MKTNVIMIRKEDEFTILQRTKDGFINATDVVKKFNKTSKLKKNKEVNRFLELDGTKKFINELVSQDVLNTPLEGVLTSRGKNGGTWMHPLVFIKLMMWCSVEFEVMATRIVYDHLIENRHLAGDNYNVLTAAGVKLKGYNFAEVAKAIQWIVIGKTEKNWRNKASQEELKETSELEKKLAFAIDMGYIKTYNQLIKELRKLWKIKNQPF